MAAVHARFTLIKTKTTGADPLVDLILTPDTPESVSYAQARKMYDSALKKSYIEACLLASQDLAEISTLLEIPIDVLGIYRSVFFDVEGFDKLSRLEVIEDSSSSEERGMKMWAVSQGLDFISWRLGRPTNLNPVEGLKEMFTLATYKSKEALFSGNASESSKEATKWTKLSMDLARLLKAWVMDTDSARKDIELALKTLEPTFDSFDSLENEKKSDDFTKPGVLDTSGLVDDIGGFEELNKGV